MANSTVLQLPKFRQKFAYAAKEAKNWFPGHMHKGMKQMQKKLKSVDCIIEVHDSRTFSGRNPQFYRMLTAIKPHILVLNKMDLVDMKHKSAIEDQLKKKSIQNIIFTNCKNQMDSGLQKMVSKAIDLIKNGEQYNRAEVNEFSIMIIGIPNVGKSSLINMLRSKHMYKGGRATQVGASPGVTKSVLERIKISEDPPVYLLDTPGVLQPRIDNVEVGMKLALCNTLKDHLVGVDIIADYLLFWLNKHQNFSYVEFLGIPAPTDDIRILLCHTAIVLKKVLKYRTPEGTVVNRPNYEAAAEHFIRAFRDGKFGRVLLDDDKIQ